MAIDARIEGVTVVAPTHCPTCNGSGNDPSDSWDDCPACHGATTVNPQVRLQLVPRERGGVAGQSVLVIVNPPTTEPDILAGMVGTAIWGGGSEIMIGNTLWAKRIGYTRIELVTDHKEGSERLIANQEFDAAAMARRVIDSNKLIITKSKGERCEHTKCVRHEDLSNKEELPIIFLHYYKSKKTNKIYARVSEDSYPGSKYLGSVKVETNVDQLTTY